MIKARVEVDGGSTWEADTSFEVKPEVGELLWFGTGAEGGRAEVVAIEHRQFAGGFVLTVIAKRVHEHGAHPPLSDSRRAPPLPEGSAFG